MSLFRFLTLLILALLSSHAGTAQTDSLIQKKDSLNAVIFQNYNEKLNYIRQQQRADSMAKAQLESQISALKTTDNVQKEILQKRLQELTSRDARRLALRKAQIDSLRATATAFPVIGFFSDTLFPIYSKLGSFSAYDRAQAISTRIQRLADDFSFRSDSLRAVPTETTVDLVVGETIITSISENDALWNNTTQTELADTYRDIIGRAVMQYRVETNFVTLAKEIGLALFTLLVIVVLVYYISKFFGWTALKLQAYEGERIRGVKINNYTLLDAKRQVAALVTINTMLKWIVILLTIYVALPVLFGIFPWTKTYADTLLGYILNPIKNILRGFLNYLPNLITVIVIVVVFRYVLKALKFLKTEIENGDLTLSGFYPDWANPTYQIVRVLVYAFMLIVIFPYLPGSDSPIFQGVSVFLGFLFTFGSAGSLSNIIAGLILTYMRLFRIGDRVKIGDVSGDVIEKSMLVTRIRTIKNELVSIPNSTVMSSHTVNYSSDAPDKGLIIHTTVTIGYDVPWRTMHQVLIDAALRTELVSCEPAPFVLQTSLEDFYVAYQINAYVRAANKQAVIYSNLHQNIQDVCNERGIEILSPHYRAARDGNASTIPAEYLPADYKAPEFSVNTTNGKTD